MNAKSFFQTLLRLYPRAFHERYGEEMARDFAESLKRQGPSFSFWQRTLTDVLSSAVSEHLRSKSMSMNIARFGAVCGACFAFYMAWTGITSPYGNNPTSLLEVILVCLCWVMLMLGFALARASKPHWLEVVGYASLIVGQGINFSPLANALNWVGALLFALMLPALAVGRIWKSGGRLTWTTMPVEAKPLLAMFLVLLLARLLFLPVRHLGLSDQALMNTFNVMNAGTTVVFAAGLLWFSIAIAKAAGSGTPRTTG